MRARDVQPNRIGELREARHWSIRELAEKSGVDHSTLNRMERGAQPLDIPRMRKIAAAFGCRLSQLLNDEDVELRADEIGTAILKELQELARDDVPAVLAMTRELVRVVRHTAAQRSAGALGGDARLVGELAEMWNNFDDERRGRALDLMRLSGLAR